MFKDCFGFIDKVAATLDEMLSFFHRHRNKFYWAGSLGALAAGGAYLYQEYREFPEAQEVRNFFDTTRRNFEIESSTRSGSVLLKDKLFPNLTKDVQILFQSVEVLVNQLKEANVDKDKKVTGPTSVFMRLGER